MKLGGLGLGLGVLCWVTGAGAQPERRGFTGDLGLGLGFTHVQETTYEATTGGPLACPGGCETSTTAGKTHVGLAGLSLTLAGYLNPHFALGARIATTSYFQDGDQWANNFYGPILEVWPHDRFFLSGGAGLGIFGLNPLFSRGPAHSETALALDFRAGVALINGVHNDFTLSGEVIPGFYSDSQTVVGYGLVAAWKWY